MATVTMRALFSKAAAALALCFFSAGCGANLVPFTHELRVQHHLSDADLKNLQYYLSDRITLRRELESGGREVTGGHTLLVISGKTIEEVVVEERTPGVALEVGPGTMAVSFEPGSSLLFAAATEPGAAPEAPPSLGFAEPPGAPPGDVFTRPPPDGTLFGGSYWLSTASGSRVRYEGTSFEAVEESLKAHLMIDAESLEEVVKSRKVLPGVRLSDRPAR